MRLRPIRRIVLLSLLCGFATGMATPTVYSELRHQSGSLVVTSLSSSAHPTPVESHAAPKLPDDRWIGDLCGVSSFLLLWSLFRLRAKHGNAQERAVSGDRMEERERIARDLHDTLIQSVQGLILTLQSLASRRPTNDPTRVQLETALDQAGSLVDEARDRVNDLRQPKIASDFPGAIEALTASLPNSHGRRCQLKVHGVPRALQPQVADHLYCVAREAITNALAHANACHIALDLHFRGSAFALSIHDDGTGLNPRQLRDAGGNGHFGIQGMRERAMQIGGRLEIGSKRGVGTLVHLELPSPFAYVSEDRRPRWRSLKNTAGRRRPVIASDPLWALFTDRAEDHEQAH